MRTLSQILIVSDALFKFDLAHSTVNSSNVCIFKNCQLDQGPLLNASNTGQRHCSCTKVSHMAFAGDHKVVVPAWSLAGISQLLALITYIGVV